MNTWITTSDGKYKKPLVIEYDGEYYALSGGLNESQELSDVMYDDFTDDIYDGIYKPTGKFVCEV